MFYSAAVGRKTGVFSSWALCSQAVTDYPGAVFRKWETLREATQHLNRHGHQHDYIDVHTAEGTKPLREYCENHSLLVPAEVSYEHTTLFNLRCGLFAEIYKNNGTVYIDLHQRDFDTGKRTEKGLLLTWDQWLALTTVASHLEDSFVRLKAGEPIHLSESLGEEVYVSIDTPYPVFNIRRWYKDSDGTLKPGREGITLRETEWSHLLNISHLIGLSFHYHG
jgi:hypothetical protein